MDHNKILITCFKLTTSINNFLFFKIYFNISTSKWSKNIKNNNNNLKKK